MYKNLLHGFRKITKNFQKFQVTGPSYSQQKSSSTNNVRFDSEIDRLVWMDMEMTGLNIEKDRILEIACIITDSDLNIIAESPNIIIHQPKEILNVMNDWCIKQHGKTGLTEACLKANTTVKEAEDILLKFLSEYITENASPLAGNSVYMDRLFLMKYMPQLNNYLHYRIIDVSTIKELCRRWNNTLYKSAPKKMFTHRADDDIKESIQELKFYKDNLMNIHFDS